MNDELVDVEYIGGPFHHLVCKNITMEKAQRLIVENPKLEDPRYILTEIVWDVFDP